MPGTCHEFPGVFHALLHHSRGFGHNDLEVAADAVGHKPLEATGSARTKLAAFHSPTCCSPRTVTSPELIWSFVRAPYGSWPRGDYAPIVHWTLVNIAGASCFQLVQELSKKSVNC